MLVCFGDTKVTYHWLIVDAMPAQSLASSSQSCKLMARVVMCQVVPQPFLGLESRGER